MASKWKYSRLDQNDEKQEEKTILINHDVNHHEFNNHFNTTSHFSSQPMLGDPPQIVDNNQLDHFNNLNTATSNHQRNPFNPISNFDNNQTNHHSSEDLVRYELKQRNGGGQSTRATTTGQPLVATKEDSIELVEYCIRPNDSLLSIALNCNCSVEELKRVNKLITDQEFYGLRYIKIPVRKYGLLSEVLIHHQLNHANNPMISLKEIKESLSNHQLDSLIGSSIEQATTSNHLNSTDPRLSSNHSSFNNLLEQQPLINFGNEDENYVNRNELHPHAHQQIASLKQNEPNASSSSKSSSTNSLIVNVGLKKTFDFDRTNGDLNKFLVCLDKDLEKMRKLTSKPSSSFIEPLDANDIHLLNSTYRSTIDKGLDCDGASCGLNWKTVFFIAIFICILLPLIYLVIYTEEHQNSINHHLNHQLNHH